MKTQIAKELFQPDKMKDGEMQALNGIIESFEKFPISTREKLENFTNWVRHRDLARFLFRSEIYKRILNIPGVIFECGVFYGCSLATWLHLGEIYEPVNYNRRVFGFDTFSGFPNICEKDMPKDPKHPDLYKAGTYDASTAENNIYELFSLLDKTRKLSQIPRMRIIKGDVRNTVREVLENDKSIIISLLYLDLDLYEPNKAVIETCLPRMPKGSIICFDELGYEDWPGETHALLDTLNLNKTSIERCYYVPQISFITI